MEIVRTPTKELANSGLRMQSLRVTDPEKLGHILTTGLYVDTLIGLCREVTSNAVDSHTRLFNQTGKLAPPIKIYIDVLQNRLVVADFGVGIAPESVPSLALGLGGSDKDSSNSELGGWGLGFKSPYAHAEQWTFDSRLDGVKYSYLCATHDGMLSYSQLGEVPTDQPNGVTVYIPLKAGEAEKALMMCRWFGRFMSSHTARIEVNGKPLAPLPNQTNPKKLTIQNWPISYRWFDKADTFGLENPASPRWEESKYSWANPTKGTFDGMILTIGGVPYIASRQGLEDDPFWNLPIHVELPVGMVDVTPSRDTLRLTERTTARLTELKDLMMQNLAADTLQNLKQCLHIADAYSILSTTRAGSTVVANAVGAELEKMASDTTALPLSPKLYIRKEKGVVQILPAPKLEETMPFIWFAADFKSIKFKYQMRINSIGSLHWAEYTRTGYRASSTWSTRSNRYSNIDLEDLGKQTKSTPTRFIAQLLIDDLPRGGIGRVKYHRDDQTQAIYMLKGKMLKDKPGAATRQYWMDLLKLDASAILLASELNPAPAQTTHKATGILAPTSTATEREEGEINALMDITNGTYVHADELTVEGKYVYFMLEGSEVNLTFQHADQTYRRTCTKAEAASFLGLIQAYTTPKLNVVSVGKSVAKKHVETLQQHWTPASTLIEARLQQLTQAEQQANRLARHLSAVQEKANMMELLHSLRWAEEPLDNGPDEPSRIISHYVRIYKQLVEFCENPGHSNLRVCFRDHRFSGPVVPFALSNHTIRQMMHLADKPKPSSTRLAKKLESFRAYIANQIYRHLENAKIKPVFDAYGIFSLVTIISKENAS